MKPAPDTAKLEAAAEFVRKRRAGVSTMAAMRSFLAAGRVVAS